jgi:RNA-binding protein
MKKLSGTERRYLRGLAHHLDPAVQVGTKGVTENLIAAISDALDRNELIKVKFGEYKGEKEELSGIIEERAGCEMAGLIGNVAIFYRMQEDEEKRSIPLPDRKPVVRRD